MKRGILAGVGALLLSQVALADTIREELLQYRQMGYEIVDPVGDRALIELSMVFKEQLYSWVFADGDYVEFTSSLRPKEDDQCALVPEECTEEAMSRFRNALRERGTGSCVVEGEPFLDENEFVAMMEKVIQSESEGDRLNPIQGIPHDWSGKFLSEYSNPFSLDPIDFGMPKLFLAMSFGMSSRFTVTGTEESLLKVILNEPENSITVEWMFRQSYRINYGNVYNALLTIENVLSKYYMVNHRELLPVTRRLKSVTGDGDCDRDRFGSWYHLWGLVLYGYYHEGRSGLFQADIVADLENFLASMISPSRSPKKAQINVLGASAGARLKNRILELQKRRQPTIETSESSANSGPK